MSKYIKVTEITTGDVIVVPGPSVIIFEVHSTMRTGKGRYVRGMIHDGGLNKSYQQTQYMGDDATVLVLEQGDSHGDFQCV
jgi:hypothetical protein